MRKALRAYLIEHAVDAAPAYGVVRAADEASINAVSHVGGDGRQGGGESNHTVPASPGCERA